MIRDSHLAVVVKNRERTTLLRLPLDWPLRNQLKEHWNSDYEKLVHTFDRIGFRAGYKLKNHQCFEFENYDLPMWLADHNSRSVMDIDEIENRPEQLRFIQGTLVITRNNQDEEIILFQDFSQSQMITPGRFIHLQGSTYSPAEKHGLLLDRQLSAVYLAKERKLLFLDFRAVNSFLPIFEFYKKVSEFEIRELLNHRMLYTENPDHWALEASQWFRVRFTQLKDSGILDRFSAEEIKARSEGYNIPLQLVRGKILFPSDNKAAKKLLQFLNEEVFKGPITDTVYVTNTKTKS